MSEAHPAGWENCRLADIADLFNGKAGGTGGTWLRVFKTRHVYDGSVRLGNPAFVPDQKASTIPESTYLRDGDTLTPNMAHGTIGRVAFVRSADRNWTVDGQIMVVRPKSESVLGRYIYDWLSRPQSKAMLVSMEKGGAFDELRGQTHIYRNDVASIPLLLPPLPEQRKIAAILSSVDEAIEGTQAVIDQLQVVKKAMMADLLTRGIPGCHKKFKQTEIGEVPAEWDVCRVGNLADIAYGLTVNARRRDSPRRLPYLTVANLQDEQFDLAEVKEIGALDGDEDRYGLRRGDVLLVKGNANVERLGRAAMWMDQLPLALHQNHLIRVRVWKPALTPAWVHLVLSAPAVREQITMSAKTSSGLNTINSSVVGGLAVPVPSREEQVSICGVIEALESRRTAEVEAAVQLRELKSALMSVLLTGEVRVRVDEESAA
jgi:restriction endonuclease S subunit